MSAFNLNTIRINSTYKCIPLNNRRLIVQLYGLQCSVKEKAGLDGHYMYNR